MLSQLSLLKVGPSCRQTPPSFPTYRVGVPSRTPHAAACWSGWVVGYSPVAPSLHQGCTGAGLLAQKSQYLPITFHVAPASVEFQTSSRPTTTSLGSVGSIETYWLYQACTPGR